MNFPTNFVAHYKKYISALSRLTRRIESHLHPRDTWVTKLRESILRGVSSHTAYSTTVEKSDADYIATVSETPTALTYVLYADGYQRNLLSTKKYRYVDALGTYQYTHSSWVKDNGITQDHVYLFATPLTNHTDIYGHYEPSVQQPVRHLNTSTGVHGDPNKELPYEEMSTYERKMG